MSSNRAQYYIALYLNLGLNAIYSTRRHSIIAWIVEPKCITSRWIYPLIRQKTTKVPKTETIKEAWSVNSWCLVFNCLVEPRVKRMYIRMEDIQYVSAWIVSKPTQVWHGTCDFISCRPRCDWRRKWLADGIASFERVVMNRWLNGLNFTAFCNNSNWVFGGVIVCFLSD